MAQRRMFSLDIVDTDIFLDLPASSQNLYFHLGMRADDDGFVSSPKKITAMVNCSGDDLKLLIAKGLVIPFDSGVCVIKDWKINNYIQNDRYRETRYLGEKQYLSIDYSGAYYKLDTQCIQNVYNSDTQVRLGKDSKGNKRTVKKADKPPRFRFAPPTVDEIRTYCTQRGNHVDPQTFMDFYTANGWKQGKGKPIVDWQAAVRTWEKRDSTPEPPKKRTGRLEVIDGEEVYVCAD